MADETHEHVYVDAAPDECFALAARFEEYPVWVQDVGAATVLARDAQGRGTRVEYRASALGRTIRYVLDYDFADAPAAFSWTLVEGDMLRALDGRYTFAADGTGTRVSYDLTVDLAVPLPGMVKRRASGLIVAAALRDLRKTVEARRDAVAPAPAPEAPEAPHAPQAPEVRAPVTPNPPAVPPEIPPEGPPEVPLPVGAGSPAAARPAPHPDAVDFDAAGTEARSIPAPSVLECLVGELLGAVPEVRDHVLEAADALLDAAKTLIDAAERVVRQQRGDGYRVSATATFGVDLGGTNVRVAVIDDDGRILDQQRAATPGTLDGIVDCIASAVRALGEAAPDAHGLGVGAAGMVDAEGVIHYAPNVPAFLRAPVRERLLGVVDMPVVVDNDANAAVAGELAHGAARGHDDVLLVTLGTGVGGGIVSGGQILRGAHGFGAEIGHFQVDPHGPPCACGGVGHWEALASGHALGRAGREHAAAGAAPSVLALVNGDAGAIEGVHVGEAALSGAPDALAIVDEYAHWVAVGLVGLVNILDPELVIVSGGLVELDGVLLDPLRIAFAGAIEGAAYRPEVPIVAATLGTHAGVIGAGVLARQLVT